MPPMSIVTILQVIVGIGLLNVWLLRSGGPTQYRGGVSQTMREEFQAYGLPGWTYYLVGGLKILAGLMLIVGIWLPVLVQPAAVVVILLMLGALAMHIKVGDPLLRSVPALLVLGLCVAILTIGR